MYGFQSDAQARMSQLPEAEPTYAEKMAADLQRRSMANKARSRREFSDYAQEQADEAPAPADQLLYADGGSVGFGARGVAGLRDMIPKMQAMGYQQAAPAPAAPSAAERLRAMIPQMEAMGYKQQPQYLARGGMVRGPGTGTSDSIETEAEPGTFIMPADSTKAIGKSALEKLATVPVKLSNGEFEFPPERVMALGAAMLKLLKDTTHKPVNGEDGGQPDDETGEAAGHEMAEAMPGGQEDDAEEGMGYDPAERMAMMPPMMFADGGMVEDDVTRVGNSYSGGNVGGNVSINGQTGGGTVSTTSWTSPVPAPAPTPVATAAPTAQQPAAAPATTAATPAPAPAPAAPMGWAERNALRSTQVTASSIQDSPERRAAQAALAPPPDAAGFQSATQRLGSYSDPRSSLYDPNPYATSNAAKLASPQGFQPRRYADGGTVQDDLNKRLERIPVGGPPGWTGGGASAPAAPAPAAQPPAAPAPAAASPAPTGALSRAASMAPTTAPEPAVQALSAVPTSAPAPATDSGQPQALGYRSAADRMGDLSAPPVSAPVIRNSTNDWAARKQLENLATAASSITNDPRWGGAGEKSQDRQALAQAQATDAALQQAKPGLDAAAMRENADNMRALMQARSGAAIADAQNASALDRTLVTERGNNTRAGIAAQGVTEAARLKALQDGKAPPGYRYTADGNMEAIPGGPADLKQNKEGVQQGKDTQDIFSILNEARPLMDKATGSYAGVAWDKAGQTFGVATEGAKATAQLKALEGALVSKMPKMSGPQSDKDVLLYKQMAGQIGDPTIPVEQRRAAMSTIENLNVKYLPAVTDAAGYQSVPSGSYYKTPAGEVRRKS